MSNVVHHVSSSIVAVVFFLWFLLTVLNHIGDTEKMAARLGIISSFIPKWNFFAPRPGIHDYHLLYRDQFSGGSMSNWKETPITYSGRKASQVIWNPSKVEEKAVLDIVKDLSRESAERNESERRTPHDEDSRPEQNLVKLSVPYVATLNYISELPRSNFSTKTQFMYVRTTVDDQSVDVVFVSALHDV